MEGQCHLCGSSRNVDMCNCPKDPIPLCEKCCDKHEFAHGKQTTTKGFEAYCTFDEYPAIQICIGCMSNLCEKCCREHAMQCGEIDLYPIELTELVAKGDEGIIRLKRGKNINRTIESLKEMLSQISERTKSDVESQFVAAYEALETAKSQTFSRVDEAVAKLSADIDTLDTRLKSIKYEESIVPTTQIEELLLTESFENIKSRFEAEQWFQVSLNYGLFPQLSSELVTVSRLTHLFFEVKPKCPWVNRYALLLGDTTQFCDLETYEVFTSPFSVSSGSFLATIQLPTGEYFVCGGNAPHCFLIDNEYSKIEEIGTMSAIRNNPGLAHYSDFIYAFGGRDFQGTDTTRTIQRFDLERRRGEMIPCEMVLERVLLTPSVWRGQIYLIGGLCLEGVEVFDPVAISIRFIPITLPGVGPTVSFLYSETKLLVLSCYQYLFDLERDTFTTFSFDKGMFHSSFHPLRYEQKVFFTVKEENSRLYKLAYMKANSTIVQFTGVEFRG